MEVLHSILIYIHIAAGIASLCFGFIPLVSKKGGRNHKKIGLLFYYSMFVVAITALLTSLYDGFTLLTHLGVFAIHLNYFGIRSLREKSMKSSPIDWGVNILGLTNAVLMITSGSVILIIFGIVSLSNVVSIIKLNIMVLRNKPIPRLAWLTQHIGLMVGAYIATVTAFLVNNVRAMEPVWLLWLLPTAVFVPLSIYWVNKYVKKPNKVATI